MEEPLDIATENERLRDELAQALLQEPVGTRATLYTKSVIALAFLCVAAIVTIFVVRPDKDNTAIISIITGILVPLITALLAAGLQQVHLAVNSRLSQLLLITQKAARAEGKLSANRDALARHDAATVRRDEAAVVATAVEVAAQLAATPAATVPLPLPLLKASR